MLQIIAIGVSFLLFGVGSIARSLRILTTSEDKRTPSTGSGERLIFIILGLIILALAIIQGIDFMKL